MNLDDPGGGGATPLPAFAYVPGGCFPRPTMRPDASPAWPGRWGGDPRHLQAVRLFDAGYYWEAHVSWEDLWAALGRSGDDADCVRALIKLAAAGVKARQGQSHGVRIHAERAESLFQGIASHSGPRVGLDLPGLIALSRAIAHDAERLAGLAVEPPDPLFSVRLGPLALIRQP